MVAMAVLCAVGVTFYMRFLIALCKECRPQGISYLVRLQSEWDDEVLAESIEPRTSLTGVA